MIYHRFIENISDLRNMFDGKLTDKIIMDWKSGLLEFWIEIRNHPYHIGFFSKTELVEKWVKRINDIRNLKEAHYRNYCRLQKWDFLDEPIKI